MYVGIVVFFLISFVDLFGLLRSKLVPARAIGEMQRDGAGFAGFALGATPTAVANMTAVTKTHGPAPLAFIILPLVGAFFVDLTNAVVIKLFLG